MDAVFWEDHFNLVGVTLTEFVQAVNLAVGAVAG
jgi:hypothetical protein